jgi:D-amino-acid oxidase
MNAIVIGAGVIGLSTAIALQKVGWRVQIWTAATGRDTTSSVAAAVWYPYKAYPEDRVLPWSSRTFAAFSALAVDPATGVQMREGVELWRDPVPDPWWRSAVPLFRRATPGDLPVGYRDGYVFTVPVIEMPLYLRYLTQRLESGSGMIEQRELQSIEEAASECDLVVNCAGLGSRDLVDDQQLFPIRGQIVRVQNPGLTRVIFDEEHPDGVTYIVPRSTDCILGGTAVEGSWDTKPDPAVAEAILHRCIALEPRLADAPFLEHRVGLRPGRPAIRLELERSPGGVPCIHNYGHGGAGVTLSWGCAEEAAGLAQTL